MTDMRTAFADTASLLLEEDPLAAVVLDLDHEAFGGLRAFLAAAVGRRGPVKWQVVGPVTMGLARAHRGANRDFATPRRRTRQQQIRDVDARD